MRQEGPKAAAQWGFREAERSVRREARTAFRDDPEHHRSVATLAFRLCKKYLASLRENLSEAQRRKSSASGERGAGKGAAALVHAQRWRNPERDQRSAADGIDTHYAVDRE